MYYMNLMILLAIHPKHASSAYLLLQILVDDPVSTLHSNLLSCYPVFDRLMVCRWLVQAKIIHRHPDHSFCMSLHTLHLTRLPT